MGQRKLFLTGASGLLGRAVYTKFIDSNWVVYGTAFTRCNKDLHKLDITNDELVAKAIKDFKPDFIIHCAAQRFPDLVEKDPVAANKLNVDATSYIITAAAEMKVPVLYISTDYVFDGISPPYEVTDKPNPINQYGKTKLKGEEITLKNSDNLVLRIPVLYGPVNNLTESAVTTLLYPLLKCDVPAMISHTEKRCPSHVDDIAHICWQLACSQQKWETIVEYKRNNRFGTLLSDSTKRHSENKIHILNCLKLTDVGFWSDRNISVVWKRKDDKVSDGA